MRSRPSASPDDSTLNLPARSMSPPFRLAGHPTGDRDRMALRRRDGGRRQAASPAQRRCADQHPAVPRRRARRRPSKLCISGARQPVRDPAPPPRPPAQFRRATTVGDRSGSEAMDGPTGPPVHLAQLAASPAQAAAKLPVMRQSIRTPDSHHQPGVRVVAPMGHAGAWPLRPVVPCGGPPKPSQSTPRPARQPPGRTAQALRDPAGHLPPPQFPPCPRGRYHTSPCPHTSAFPRVTTDPGTIDNRACC